MPRTYRTYKKQNVTEPYYKVVISKQYRAALGKLRCSSKHTRFETKRKNNLGVDHGLCPFRNTVENCILHGFLNKGHQACYIGRRSTRRRHLFRR